MKPIRLNKTKSEQRKRLRSATARFVRQWVCGACLASLASQAIAQQSSIPPTPTLPPVPAHILAAPKARTNKPASPRTTPGLTGWNSWRREEPPANQSESDGSTAAQQLSPTQFNPVQFNPVQFNPDRHAAAQQPPSTIPPSIIPTAPSRWSVAQASTATPLNPQTLQPQSLNSRFVQPSATVMPTGYPPTISTAPAASSSDGTRNRFQLVSAPNAALQLNQSDGAQVSSSADVMTSGPNQVATPVTAHPVTANPATTHPVFTAQPKLNMASALLAPPEPFVDGDDDLLIDDATADQPTATGVSQPDQHAAAGSVDQPETEPAAPQDTKSRTPKSRIKIPRVWAIPGAEEPAKQTGAEPLPTVPNDFDPQQSIPSGTSVSPNASIGSPDNGTAQPNGPATVGVNAANANNNGLIPPLPQYIEVPPTPVQTDCYGIPAPYTGTDFFATPMPGPPTNPAEEAMIYRGKVPVDSQRPIIEWGRPIYTAGLYPPANSFFFGETNLLQPHFWVYGDYRTGVAVNQNQAGTANSWAHRLNLDMDLQFTATERLHAFMGPLDRGNDFTRLDFSDAGNIDVISRTDMRLDTLFFEGDVGAIIGGREGTFSPFDLPFSVGLMPLVYQNGIWMEDALMGAAFAIPARHSAALDWSNYEVSFFALTDNVTSDAFLGDDNAAEIFGAASFIEAYDGYLETGYAFVHDDVGGHRSYHNASVSFTRRYLSRLSNSIRFITNFDQALPRDQRTADGYLILLENSLISANPNFFVPYMNFFYGSGRPQSVARAAGSGGILRNTGINFETDALTGYPTLDATANNTYGAAFGLNMLGSNFTHQLVLEFAALAGTGSQQFRAAPGDQYAAGVRYQKPISNRWIFRADSMYGWLRDSEDIFGNRIEFRWKF